MRPPKLTTGDKIRFVSPASTPSREHIDECARMLSEWGLLVETGPHAFDEFGYLAGNDEDRLADINAAFRDPEIRAVIATRGGKGAYRIADRLDFDAVRKDPKLLIGFSDITILHLSLYKNCRLAGLHAASWTEEFSSISTASLHSAMFSTDAVTLQFAPAEPTSVLTTHGVARGVLLGGNQDMISTAAGWTLPSFDQTILMLEATDQGLGSLDRQLTMLRHGGHLRGVVGIAIGRYNRCGPSLEGMKNSSPGMRTCLDVLRDHLAALDVPVLGGLSIGHGDDPVAVPVGTIATLDADQGTLKIEAAVI